MEHLHFLNMGHYGFYVWTSYGVALAILAGNVMISRRMRKKTLRILQEKNT